MVEEFDVYLGIEKDQECAWVEIEQGEGFVTVEIKGENPKPAEIGLVSIFKIMLDGEEVFKFNIASKYLKKMYCKELQEELTECYKDLSYEKDGVPFSETY